jgi:hypothetical protein
MSGKERMQAFDLKQRQLVVAAVEAGEDGQKALHRIKQETYQEYISILAEYSDVPVYPLPFPANERSDVHH